MMAFERDGITITVRLHDIEVAMLGDLAAQLVVLLRDRAMPSGADAPPEGSAAALLAQLGIGGHDSAPSDPALARLLPDAYRNDGEASSEHRRLTELGLVDRKISNAQLVVSSLATDPVELGPDAAQAWLRTLTDLRLTLAARLQIVDDGDDGTGDDAMFSVYDWLGYLQGTLLNAIEHREGDDER